MEIKNQSLQKFHNFKLEKPNAIVGGKISGAIGADGGIYVVNWDAGQVRNVVGKEVDWCDVWHCE